jgi:hypothetical protein
MYLYKFETIALSNPLVNSNGLLSCKRIFDSKIPCVYYRVEEMTRENKISSLLDTPIHKLTICFKHGYRGVFCKYYSDDTMEYILTEKPQNTSLIWFQNNHLFAEGYSTTDVNEAVVWLLDMDYSTLDYRDIRTGYDIDIFYKGFLQYSPSILTDSGFLLRYKNKELIINNIYEVVSNPESKWRLIAKNFGVEEWGINRKLKTLVDKAEHIHSKTYKWLERD